MVFFPRSPLNKTTPSPNITNHTQNPSYKDYNLFAKTSQTTHFSFSLLIANLSNLKVDTTTISLLKKGFNHALTTRCVPYKDILCNKKPYIYFV
jgi:hypothetical protein